MLPFASRFLDLHGITDHVKDPPSDNLGMTVIIPCYNEPGLFAILETILQADPPTCRTEVMVIVNDGEHDSPAIKKQNQETFQCLNGKKRSTSHITVHALYYKDLPDKHAGAGYARKLGMDQAIYRFNAISNPNGILVSLDADTRVEKNYLTEIEKAFQQAKTPIQGCNIHFEHPLQGTEHVDDVYKAITLYELRLRYYKNALASTGFPYAYHTVGSCFAVRAETYIKQGGMNKRQGGEDFYFLNKIFPLGGFKEISTTTVYPSPRPSDRVPFGTGPSVQKSIDQSQSLNKYYSLDLFWQLQHYFSSVLKLYGQQDESAIHQYLNGLPPEIRYYLQHNAFIRYIQEINRNVSSEKAFQQRFFNYFNAFKVVKFLNEASSSINMQANLIDESIKLLKYLGIRTDADDETGLLKIFRMIDRHDAVISPQQ